MLLFVPVPAFFLHDFYYEKEIEACEETIKKVREVVGDTPIVIDYLMHPRPLGLAKYLLEHGFCVEAVYLDGVSPDHKFCHFPDSIKSIPPCAFNYIHKIWALGEPCCFLSQCQHFSFMISWKHAHLWLNGRAKLQFRRMFAKPVKFLFFLRAYKEEKEVEDLVVRKGWGCESCI